MAPPAVSVDVSAGFAVLRCENGYMAEYRKPSISGTVLGQK
jgi:hypothetical protein